MPGAAGNGLRRLWAEEHHYHGNASSYSYPGGDAQPHGDEEHHCDGNVNSCAYPGGDAHLCWHPVCAHCFPIEP
jgi:hypothetical protein